MKLCVKDRVLRTKNVERRTGVLRGIFNTGQVVGLLELPTVYTPQKDRDREVTQFHFLQLKFTPLFRFYVYYFYFMCCKDVKSKMKSINNHTNIHTLYTSQCPPDLDWTDFYGILSSILVSEIVVGLSHNSDAVTYLELFINFHKISFIFNLIL